MLTNTVLALLVALAPAQHVHPQDVPAPSALSAEQMKQLLDGDGMGLARPAELNQYPGPKHVLDLAKELKLTSDQQKEISAIREEMLARARPLGRSIVDAERELDTAFKSGKVVEADLKRRLDAIAKLHGDLRLVHLRAHLLTRPLLSADQIKIYGELRGHAGH
jgi:hypothetical protein